MIATNHALTGALIGLLVGQPLVAIPAAFASHFICDALPHFAPSMPVEKWLRTMTFQRMLMADALGCMLLVFILALTTPEHWLLAAICAFMAAAPDLFWINEFIVTRRGKKWHPNLFSRFGVWIQWFERPIGGVVEVVWAVTAIGILSMFVS